MRPLMPTLAQVDDMPSLIRHQIPAQWQDSNGHVNVQYYLTLYDRGGWPLLESLGIDVARSKQRKYGFFDLEHHVWYLKEIHVGDAVTVHCRLVERGPKRLHGVMFIANRTRAQLASVMEFLSSAADLEARKTAEIPPQVAARIDSMLLTQHRYAWPVPLCGAMSV